LPQKKRGKDVLPLASSCATRLSLWGLEQSKTKMQDVPKIVKERLKVAATAAPNHPDADVLAAFSERLLSEADRAIVLEHLSRCGECRDVVALALPAEEVSTVVMPSPSRGWAWPALRWGLVAAGVVVVGAVGIVQYRQHDRSMTASQPVPVSLGVKEARNEPPASLAATEPAKKQESTASAPAAQAAPAGKVSLAAMQPRGAEQVSPARAESPAGSGRGLAGGIGFGQNVHTHGPRMNWSQNNGMQNNAAQNNAAAPAPPPFARQQARGEMTANQVAVRQSVPAVSQTVTVEVASAAPVQTAAANQVAVAGELAPQAQASPQPNYDEGKVSRSKPAEPPTPNAFHGDAASTTAEVPLNGRNFSQLVTLSAGSSPIWSISAAGGLQRSLDQGQTWRDVDVNETVPALSKPALNKSVGGPTSDARVKVAAAGPLMIFRAVAANGPDVWAGGSGSRLYHSADAGAHWSRIAPSTADATLTGDVIRLDFPNAAHGTVSTSTGEIWTTANGGQSWQKQ
jgi:hypothetical protein